MQIPSIFTFPVLFIQVGQERLAIGQMAQAQTSDLRGVKTHLNAKTCSYL